jgi:enterochelin esterase-like enzyme
LIPNIDRTYRPQDRSRSRAVEGYSMGGFGAAHLGFKYPETFGVVSVLAGSLNRYEDFAERNSKSFREAFGTDKDYFEKNEPWGLAKENRDAIRDGSHVRIVVRDEDPVYDGNKAFHEHLKQLEIEHQFRVVDGVMHDYERLLDVLDDKAFEIYRKQWGRAEDKAR